MADEDTKPTPLDPGESDSPDSAAPEQSEGEPKDEGPDQGPVSYLHTKELPDLFSQMKMSLFVSTYQAGKLLVIRPGSEGKLSLLMRNFPKPMGMALSKTHMALGTRHQVWVFRNLPGLKDEKGKPIEHDLFYVPRHSSVTGDVAVHEMAWGLAPGSNDAKQGMLWFVNTRFSCLATMDMHYSFRPLWKPPFISQLLPEDRCHLNGMAMSNGRPTYVSMLGSTDTRQGWRDNKVSGGQIMDVATGEVVTAGMAMPHSPRLHNGRLYVLESGLGELQRVDIQTGKRDTVAKFPGYTRGLAFLGPFAFVGLSKIREKREFGGLPIETMVDELECGVHVVDLDSGRTVGAIKFDSGCTELFDVQAVPRVTNPSVVGFSKDTINGIFDVPPAQREQAPQPNG